MQSIRWFREGDELEPTYADALDHPLARRGRGRTFLEAAMLCAAVAALWVLVAQNLGYTVMGYGLDVPMSAAELAELEPPWR